MAFAIFQSQAVDEAGNILGGAEVEVLVEATSALATDLYQDRAGSTLKANPFFADPDGYFYFFAPGRAYRVTVRKNGYERVWRYVAVGLNAESDTATGGVTDGDKGDITVSGGGAIWTIDAGVVTYSKIQSVSSADRVLGRTTTPGAIQEIACTLAARNFLAQPDIGSERTTIGLGNTDNVTHNTITATAKANRLGTNGGLNTALAETDCNIQLYRASSVNWAGFGASNNGDVWIRTGLSGTPDARFVAFADGGICIPAGVTGGSQGVGTLNAAGLYVNGVAVGGGGGGGGMSGPPGGRLSFASGTPIMVTTLAAQTTVYYTPYLHNQILIYNGSTFTPTAFAELSQTTADATKSPGAVAPNSNYDIFVWNDSGTMRATRGPAWSTATSRGSGAGTTELTRVAGVILNAQNITNGPAAQRGTYVGTIRSNVAAQLDWIVGGSAAGGQPGSYNVWNCYNRRLVAARVSDTTTSWNYSSLTIRAANGSNGNRISFVMGLAEDGIAVSLFATPSSPTVGAFGRAGPGLDTTTNYEARATFICGSAAATLVNAMTAVWNYDPQIGFHFISANEVGDGTNTITWNGTTPLFNCLAVSLIM